MATTVLGLKTFAASDPVDYNEINDNYTKIDNGVKTALQGRAAHNLLDNSNFTNPVNQRGQTQISENGYFIDRWMNYTGSQVLVSGGVQTTASGNTAYLSQYIESSSLRDGVYSFAAKVNGSICIRVIRISGTTITTVSNAEAGFKGGYLNATYANSGRFEFMLRVEDGNSIVTEWAALYEGSYTADTLPAYVPKDSELEECQLYHREEYVVPVIKVQDAIFLIGTVIQMRDMGELKPTITLKKFTRPGVIDVTSFGASDRIDIENLGKGRYLLMNAILLPCQNYEGGFLRFSINADI